MTKKKKDNTPDAQITLTDYSSHEPDSGGPIYVHHYKLHNNTITTDINDPTTGDKPDHLPQTIQDIINTLNNHITEGEKTLKELKDFQALLHLPGITFHPPQKDTDDSEE